MSDCQQKKHIPQAGQVRLLAEKAHSTVNYISDCLKKNHIPQTGYVKLSSVREHTIGRTYHCQIVFRKSTFHRQDKSEKHIYQADHVRLSAERAHSMYRTYQIVSRKSTFRIHVGRTNTFHIQDMSDCQQQENIPQAEHNKLSAERTHSTAGHVRLSAEKVC